MRGVVSSPAPSERSVMHEHEHETQARIDEVERYAIPAPYVGEGNELLNTLDGERQEIAHALGTEHPLYKLVDGALRSADIDELRTARAAAAGWPSDGWEGDWEFPGDVCEVDGEEIPC